MAFIEDIPYPILLTDCSAPGVRVGVLDPSGWPAYCRLEGETVAELFKAVDQVLKGSGLSLEDLGGFTYCEGPGSTMGIRINAMAIRTWNQITGTPKPVYAYRSLPAAALLIQEQQPRSGSFSLFSDLRKNAWNALRCGPDSAGASITVVHARELETWPRPFYFLQQRLHSPSRPEEALDLDYDLKPVGPLQAFAHLWRQADPPGVFQTTRTEFKKWTPTRHR